MDRLFLQALAAELRPQIVGKRIRSAVLDREESILTLGLSARSSLRVSALSDAAGPFLGGPARSGATTPGLRKWIVSSSIVGVAVAELDRVLTLRFEQARLSGRTTKAELVLEVLGNRVGLYLVDAESASILESFSRKSRAAPGERYEPPPPPPGAAPEATSAEEFESRRRASPPRRAALLAASGLTPLAVREMEWLIDEKGLSEREAFAAVRAALHARRPRLYVAPEASPEGGKLLLLSPLELESERRLEPRSFSSFSDALAAAVELSTRVRAFRAVRARLDSSVSKGLEKARRLREKLRGDAASLEEPGELRLLGEKLLAGMSRAKRSADGRVVVVPDSFDAEESEVEIPIDPRLPLAANAERFFARARKMERARREIEARLESIEARISYWEGVEWEARIATELSELEALEHEARDQGLFPALASKTAPRAPGALGPRRFRSRRGSVILVGRSGRSNDETTFRIAGPGDLWFHASGIPGAHVVLRPAPGSAVDEGEIEDAASLAAYYSRGRNDTRVDVLVTERRNVSKIKGGPPGLVKVQNVRTVRVAPRLLEEEREAGPAGAERGSK